MDRFNRASIAKYRDYAGRYDRSARRTQFIRLRAIAGLHLRPGDTVLDAGCGTGLSLPMLRDAVGAGGRVIGVEQSPDMAELCRRRIAEHGWDNVVLLEGALEDVSIPARLDALLFNYTHDILQTEAAVAAAIGAARPGARVAAAGVKFMPWWVGPLNLHVWYSNRKCNARTGGLWAPWRILRRHVPLAIESTFYGRAYIAHGTLSPTSAMEPPP